MTSQRWLLRPLAAALALAMAPACSGDKDEPDYVPVEEPPPPTGTVEVSVEYPSARDETAVAVVQMWVLVRDESGEVTCAKLIGGEIAPHDLRVVQTGEARSTDTDAMLVDDSVEVGTALVYVEATDYLGNVQLAGCTNVEVTEEATESVTVPLRTARVYICSDDATEDGAPCDDGDFCTVGDSCDHGECEPGAERDCSHLDDECNVGTCEEPLGCIRDPLPNGTQCDDGLYCTEGDTCRAGQCVGSAVDCDELAGTCEVAVGCDEDFGGCVIEDAEYGEPCDDGEFCTDNDACDGFGSCSINTPTDCSVLTDQCNNGICDELNDQCDVEVLLGYACEDGLYCTLLSECDETGTCVGTSARDCSVWDVDDCNVGRCVEQDMACETVFAPVDTVCDDGDACTTDTVCNDSGTCGGGTAVTCDGLCDTGVCNSLSGCLHVPSGTLCNGALDDCTQYCDSFGECLQTNAPTGAVCDDLNPCTTESYCNNGTGTCTYAVLPVPDGGLCLDSPGNCARSCLLGNCVTANAADTTPCDDGNPCTSYSECSAGACDANPVLVPTGQLCLDALDDCTQTCDATGTCVATPAGDATPCDDGDPTTSGDVCTSQVCAGF